VKSTPILAQLVLPATLLLGAAAPDSGPVRHGAVTDHVIVVSIDGLRPDAIQKYNLQTLTRLMREGSYSLSARTILPSKTLPSHTSMLTGLPPAAHGVTWNSDRTDELGTVDAPTIFSLAKKSGYTTAAFFSKAKFHHLQQPGSLDYTQAPNGPPVMATQTIPDAIRYLEKKRPNLLFVHIAEPDYAGHAIGWMSSVYGWAARRADGAVGSLLAAADRAYGADGYTVIITADHGGHGRDHGSDDPRDVTIPWIAWGTGVGKHGQLGVINTMDTAATVLWLLGIREPANWQGVPAVAAFTDDARAAADAALASAAVSH
jgi:predicted AlkP superfamily pyrophosphatase or phosphodiesterase